MSYKNNPYPVIPTQTLIRGVWSEMQQAKQNYIAHRVYPVTIQDVSDGKFYKMKANDDQLYEDTVSPTDKAPELSSSQNDVSFKMKEVRFNYLLDPKKINKAPNRARKRMQEEETGKIITTRACRLFFEKMAADNLFKESTWGFEDEAGADISNKATDIITILNNFAEEFESINGYLPRKIVMNSTVLGWMLNNTGIRDKIPTQLWNNLTSENILLGLRGGKLENLEEILIGRTSYTISNVKENTVVRGKLWSSDYIWMGDIDDTIAGTSIDTTESATAGVVLDGSEEPTIRVWRDEHMKAGVEYIEAGIDIGVVNVDTNKGVLITNLLNA